jgi:hypothetical protein
MNKKILLIGILLIVIVVVIGIFAPSSVSSPFQVSNITIAHGNYSSMAFNITSNRTLFVILGSSNIPIDIYLFNSTGFNIWQSKIRTSPYEGYAIANSLNNDGVIGIFHNTTALLYQNGASSQNVSSTTNGVVFYNKTSAFYGNTIFVFDNDLSNNTNAQVSINYISPTPINAISNNSKLSGFGTQILEIYSALFIIGIIGLALIVYGLIKKDTSAAPNGTTVSTTDIEERDKLYSKIKSPTSNSNNNLTYKSTRKSKGPRKKKGKTST